MIKIDKMRCVGCGLCVEECPQGALSISGTVASVNEDECVECLSCIEVCPQSAIKDIELREFLVAFGSDDGESLKGDTHVGMSRYFVIYRICEDAREFVERRENVKYQEDETLKHGDPGKARAVSSALEGVDVIVGQRFGPNITRLRNKFLCVVVRKDCIEEAARIISDNFLSLLEEAGKEERAGIVLRG